MALIFLERVFPVQNRKNEHHHQIPHTQLNLGTKILQERVSFTQKNFTSPSNSASLR